MLGAVLVVLAWPAGAAPAATITGGSQPTWPARRASRSPLVIVTGARLEASNIEIVPARRRRSSCARSAAAHAHQRRALAACHRERPTRSPATSIVPGYRRAPTLLIQVDARRHGDDRFASGVGAAGHAPSPTAAPASDTADYSARTTPVAIGAGGSEPIRELRALHRRHGQRRRSAASPASRRRSSAAPGVDRVTYDDRRGDVPIAADSDGVADDGTAGEGDNIDPSVENIIGGAGNDVLGGVAGVANVLDGGPGIDTASYGGRPRRRRGEPRRPRRRRRGRARTTS